jgi:tripeptide aminopeptidase
MKKRTIAQKVLLPEPDLARAEKLVAQLIPIPGGSGREGRVADFVERKLLAAGAPRSAIRRDQAHQRSVHGGETGNLVFRLPGTTRGPRRLLMAHLDTVPLAVGARPVRRGDELAPADAGTALGADDRAGVAVVLTAALEVLRRGLPHPPLVFLWTVQEETGLHGARHAGLGLLGNPRLAFNFDGRSPEEVTIGATGGYRMDLCVRGVASHAGVAPQRGVSAIAIAALAIARLHQEGWHGRVEKDGRWGTSNVGVIHGGDATNVVTPLVEVRAEARSHDPEFRAQIVAAIERAFRDAAGSVRNADGACGEVEVRGRLDYEAFRLADDEPCVLAAEAAVRATGGEPVRAISSGGLDANWLSARGIPTVTLGSGMVNAHTTAERLDLRLFRQACRIGLRLATGTE